MEVITKPYTNIRAYNLIEKQQVLSEEWFCDVELISESSKKLAWVHSPTRGWNILNYQGKYVLNTWYSKVRRAEFNESYAVVKNQGVWKIIHDSYLHRWQELSPVRYEYIHYVHSGLHIAKRTGEGNFEFLDDEAKSVFENPVEILDSKIIEWLTNYSSSPSYEDIRDLRTCIVRLGNHYGVFNIVTRELVSLRWFKTFAEVKKLDEEINPLGLA